MSLTLTQQDYAAVLAHVRAELPHEACGLLAGIGGMVRRVYPVENIYHSPWAFHMDPAEQVRVILEIEAAGWELSGIFHSHPSGPPGPSATDVALAYYPEAVYLILAPEANEGWCGRGFMIEDGRVTEVPVRVV